MIVNDGKNDLAALVLAKYTRIKVGDGSDTTSASQEDLDNPVFTKSSGVTVTRVNNVLTWNFTISGADLPAGGATELGVFSNDSDDIMLTRVTFKTTGPIAASDSVTFTVKLEVA